MTTPTPRTDALFTVKNIGPATKDSVTITDLYNEFVKLERDLAAAQERIKEFEEVGVGLTRSHVGLINSLAHAQEALKAAESDKATLLMDAIRNAQQAQAAEARAEGYRLALAEIREEWAGAECGEPVTAQEAYAIQLAKRMYQIAVDAIAEGK